MSKLSISRTVAKSFKRRLANVVPAIGRDRVETRKVDTVRREVRAATRDAMTATNPVVRRAVSADLLVAMRRKATLNNLRAVIRVEVRPVTVKARRADERDTDKAHQGIDADTLRINVKFSREDRRRSAGIRHGHPTVVRVEPPPISVRHVVNKRISRRVVIKTIRRRGHLNPNRLTMTSEVDVVASSRTTRRNRRSISVLRGHRVPREHVRLDRLVASVRSVAVTFPTMRLRSKDRRVGTRLNAVRLADRAVMGKRAIANCRLAAEASGQLRRPVR